MLFLELSQYSLRDRPEELGSCICLEFPVMHLSSLVNQLYPKPDAPLLSLLLLSLEWLREPAVTVMFHHLPLPYLSLLSTHSDVLSCFSVFRTLLGLFLSSLCSPY